MRRLAKNVTTPDESGRMVTLMAGDEVSAEVAKGITAEGVWEDDSDEKPAKKAAAKKSGN